MATTSYNDPSMTGMSDSSVASTANDPTIERFKQGAHDAVDRIADKAGPTVERLKSKMGDASTSLRTHVDEMHTLQEEWMVNCRATVRDNPLTSVAVGVLAGMLLGRVLGR